MSVVTKIISVVLKSVADNKISNELAKELIGVSIDEVSEFGINKIKDFIKGEKSNIDNILSKDNMQSMNIPKENTDYVVSEIKDLFSSIDITDDVLKQCRYDNMNLSVFLWNEYRKIKDDYIDCEREMKRCLFAVADALIELVRESKNFEKDILIQMSNSIDDANVGLQYISEYMEDNFNKLDADNQTVLEILQMILEQNQENSANNKGKKKKIKSRTQEYADKWEANMFLNDFDKRDENAGINVKLSEVYLDEHLPNYCYLKNKEPSNDLKSLLSEYIEEKGRNKMLLILGQPGIGKSTLITWIVANFTDKADDVLVYQFATDLKNLEWQNGVSTDEILSELNLSYDALTGKILILDGFDEISIQSARKELLDKIYADLTFRSVIKNFALIITCRENYIQKLEMIHCQYITLQTWNELQIRSFCKIFGNRAKSLISENTVDNVIENKEILGIPLILYIVLALNICIEKEVSIVDIYDKIFSLEGGIYDRCIDNKKFAGDHRIGDVKRQIHQISREIALWIFENNSEETYVPKEEYEKICAFIGQENNFQNYNIKQDFMIGNYFKLVKHCDGIGSDKLYFVHRSIYEYFVAETIYSYAENAMKELKEESQVILVKNIPFLLKMGKISHSIGEYLQYKIIKLYNRLDSEKKKLFYQWWENAFAKIIHMGMFFLLNKVFRNIKTL